jgi:hypothetical protein
MKSKWFDEISLVYARNYVEVAAAEANFEAQRAGVLDELRVPLKRAIADAKVDVIEGSRRHDSGFEDWWLRGRYHETRIKAGKKDNQAAIEFGIGADTSFAEQGAKPEFGFGCYVFFTMSKSRFRRLRDALTPLVTELRLQLAHDEGLYIRTAWIQPTDTRFSLDAFVESVEQLPDWYKKLDQPIAEAYQRAFFTDDE